MTPLAVTMGDPAGIGLDIAIGAWRVREQRRLPPFVLYADPRAVGQRARQLGVDVAIEPLAKGESADLVFRRALPVVALDLDRPPVPGRPDPANAKAVISAIEQAMAAVVSGAARALVTNPIAKATLYEYGFAYPGHTEFLGALAERHYPGRRVKPVMMLVADNLRVVPLTVHMPLANVPSAITRALILDTARLVHRALGEDFAIASPRLALTGLNPHAGEEGALGREEEETIAPAIATLRAEGLSVTGPHPADTLFHRAARETYDAAIAMYHDQALIPVKTLAFDTGVNVTLGLPFVRTSPDHGTAFAIAGSGRASPESFIASLMLADRIASRRAASAHGRPHHS